MKEYSIGLSLQNDSIGWAVIDNENSKIVKKNGKRLYGVRMFDEAQTSTDRRMYRQSRRLINRRNERIKLLNMIFKKEIDRVDDTFLKRLNESFLDIEDKYVKSRYTLFNDKDFNDQNFFKKFPTIYHLRNYLYNSNKQEDIRYIYLAVHHILKKRGNFLYNGDFNVVSDDLVVNTFNSINNILLKYSYDNEDEQDLFTQLDFSQESLDKLKLVLASNDSKVNKTKKLRELFGSGKDTFVSFAIIPLLIGSKVNISKFKFVKEQKYEKCEIDLTSENYLEQINNAAKTVVEIAPLIRLLEALKNVVDFYFISDLLKSNNKADSNISSAMIKVYNNHKKDLEELKMIVKKYCPKEYNNFFRKYDAKYNNKNYAAYVGGISTNSKKKSFGHCSKEEFYNSVEGLLKQLDTIDDSNLQKQVEAIRFKISNNTYMPKLNSTANTAFPMQLNLEELTKILNNQKKYYPFLNDIDETGLNNIDKIISIFKFKIPYYIGPLSKHYDDKNNHAWIVKKEGKENDRIYPWNLETIVDTEATALEFINRMLSKCTYLKNEFTLCKDTIIYSAYNVLSFINSLYINGTKISVKDKQDLFTNLFLNKKTVSKTDLNRYFSKLYNNTVEITYKVGKLDKVPCNMSSYVTMKSYLQEEFSIELADNIISDIAIFKDESLLKNRFKQTYKLNDKTIKVILNECHYNGYGNLSYYFLNQFPCLIKETGEVSTLLEEMWNTNDNLQEILYSRKDFLKRIDEENKKDFNDNQTIEDFIKDNIYTSPAMSRALIQCYRIIEEVEQILGQKIDKYYILSPSVHKNSKKATVSRYDKLKEIFKNESNLLIGGLISKSELKALKLELEEYKDKLKADNYYLYFTQLGKDMYTLENININMLKTSSKYNIDHIYPKSIVEDESFSNKALSKKSINANIKEDNFICDLDNFLAPNAKKFYELLMNNNLITKEKYRRLTIEEITPVELSRFINKEIVLTNQSIKGLADILKIFKKVDSQNIVYCNADTIATFRRANNFVKSKTANNYYIAHDAYLCATIGKVLNDYYTKYSYLYIDPKFKLKKEQRRAINPQKILDNPKNWNKAIMLDEIRQNLYERFDVLETTRTYTKDELLAKVTIQPAGNPNSIPVTENGPKSNVEKYGGYTSLSYYKYCIIKENETIKLVAIPYKYNNINGNNERMLNYLGKDVEIIYDDLKVNTVIKYDGRKYCITGKTADSFCIKNLTDRNYNYNLINIIHKLEKYNNFISLKEPMTYLEDKVIIAPAKNSKCTEISLTKDELNLLYTEVIAKLSRKEYSYSCIENIVNNSRATIIDLDIKQCLTIATEILNLCRTNKRQCADLTLLMQSKSSGSLTMSNKLKSGMKIIAESITGYYEKILYEVE